MLQTILTFILFGLECKKQKQFFFYGGRDLNLRSYIYYALSLTAELSS